MSHYIYLLHFTEPYWHAQHYLGVTPYILARLDDHANGRGSALTKALWKAGLHWQLAALGLVTEEDLYKAEREAKKQHHAPRYCPLCSPCTQQPLPYSTSYPVETINFPIDTKGLRKCTKN